MCALAATLARCRRAACSDIDAWCASLCTVAAAACRR
jgi:hypothetical protein